nr:MAG TPA: hypothetical protein [Crassvirales sp.]
MFHTSLHLQDQFVRDQFLSYSLFVIKIHLPVLLLR